MSTTTDFDTFKRLLDEAIAANDDLTTAMQTALRARVALLTKLELLELGDGNAEAANSTNVTIAEATDSITVTDSLAGVVTWAMETYDTPMRVIGARGVDGAGALIGDEGGAGNARVDVIATVTIQYRLSSTDTWKAFDRTTYLTGITAIQFRANITAAAGDRDLPKLWVVLEQK